LGVRRWVGQSPFYDLVKRILLMLFIATAPLTVLFAGGYSAALPQPYRPLFWAFFFGLIAGPTYALLHKRLNEATELDDKQYGKSQKEAQARWIAEHEGSDA
jgi:hypothetical protein